MTAGHPRGVSFSQSTASTAPLTSHPRGIFQSVISAALTLVGRPRGMFHLHTASPVPMEDRPHSLSQAASSAASTPMCPHGMSYSQAASTTPQNNRLQVVPPSPYVPTSSDNDGDEGSRSSCRRRTYLCSASSRRRLATACRSKARANSSRVGADVGASEPPPRSTRTPHSSPSPTVCPYRRLLAR